jgi:exopolyphosphatase / guanosine-5'-triphosphate,3'-diphosphate pyrophosphatase
LAAHSKAAQETLLGYPETIHSEKNFKVSVIDLGFNSLKLANFEIDQQNHYRTYELQDAKVKLGEGLDETGFLGSEAIQRTIEALKVFHDIVNVESIHEVLAVATSALRESADKEAFRRNAFDAAGFNFQVLTEEQEALYSYTGAVKATRIPTCLFFDLGGGSLELVYAENYKIRKVLSLPLGARRLTYLYGEKDGTFKKKNYELMRERIVELLPSKKELSIPEGIKLLGVGGTIRAISKYHQELTHYPIEKTHNYAMDYDAVHWVSTKLEAASEEQLASIKAFSGARAETMIAGSCVVATMMEAIGSTEVVTSFHGLREGTLSVFLTNPIAFQSGKVSRKEIEDEVKLTLQEDEEGNEFLTGFRIAGLINEREEIILSRKDELLREVLLTSNLPSLFVQLLGADSSLSHSEQLLLATSLIGAENRRTAERIAAKYSGLLSKKSRRAIKRLSPLLRLLRVLEQGKIEAGIKKTTDAIEIELSPRDSLPLDLLEQSAKALSVASGITVRCSIAKVASNRGQRAVSPVDGDNSN